MISKMSTSEKITYSTVLIKSQLLNGAVSTGTGFIMNLCFNENTKQCIPVVITNKHVAQNSTLTVFEFVKQDSNGMPLDKEVFGVNYQVPQWIMHPNDDIDLCCLPIAPILNQLPTGIKVFYIPLETSLIPTEHQLKELTALEEVLMIGYPIGLSDYYNHKPILRRGTTATHAKNDYQGKKDFLIDIACFPGSSGSPILILNEGAFTTPHGITVGSRIMLLGVLHSGPQFTAKGTITFTNLPNAPTPSINVPMNLGIAVKATEILKFEDILNKMNEGGTTCE
ncbi:MAG: S1 family peptidase [Limisphaerales bacterium]